MRIIPRLHKAGTDLRSVQRVNQGRLRLRCTFAEVTESMTSNIQYPASSIQHLSPSTTSLQDDRIPHRPGGAGGDQGKLAVFLDQPIGGGGHQPGPGGAEGMAKGK